MTESSTPAAALAAEPLSRAGRNLPVAVAVGVALGAAVLVPLFTYRPVFVGVVAAAIGYACYEISVVLREAMDRRIPLVALLAGMAGTYVAAYRDGSRGLAEGVLLTAVAVMAWRRVRGGPPAEVAADVVAGLWVLAYLVLLAGFAILLTAPSDGARRATCFVATAACSDIGGYAAGVLFGKHLLAPRVSPKKSWEGLAGSTAACTLGGALLVGLTLHAALWQGALFGLAVVATATVGDLCESLLKRDLGVKDMGSVLPGHGGILDRLDSLLLTAPVAYLILVSVAPPT